MMMAGDDYIIRDEAALRAVIGAEVPGLAAKNTATLDSFATDFIAKCPFIILATADSEGNLDASPKGDAAGFVEVVDDHTLIIPDRPGNKLAYGHLNILQSGKVGLIFMIPGTRETLRVNGDAHLTADPQLLSRLSARGKPATLAMQVHTREVFFHCAKAFIRSGLWASESWPEPHKVSFGEIFAARQAAGAATPLGPDAPSDVAAQLDAAIDADYQNNL